MNKHHVKEKLSEYIDGMLSQEEASAVKEHMDRCPECMEEYEEMVKIIGHMNQMENLETPEFFVEKVHDRIEKPKSLQRFIKRLFFPLRIKIPLELAGVAAAALLVIYIVGIRGKQQVYEIAYAQRSQPSAVLQEKIVVVGAEADEAATLSRKAKPELELKEKKVEKTDKRIDAHEEITAGKKDLPDLAPHEKKLESRAKVEEAVPRSKMIQERGEREPEPQKEAIEGEALTVGDATSLAKAPSVAKDKKIEVLSDEFADKEKGATKENALAKPTYRDDNLEDIIAALGGRIIESEYNEDTQVLESFILEIPAEKYQKLIQTLEERGEIQKPYPAIKEKDQEVITIRLLLKQ
jgi:hypothetical protein